MVNRLQVLAIADEGALDTYLVAMRFEINRHRIDPLKTFCEAIPRDADPFEVALCLERLAGSIRRAVREGRLP